MTDEKNCKSCKYYIVTEPYWYDHYLISSHHCCTYSSPYTPKDIDPLGCCEHYQPNSDTETNA